MDPVFYVIASVILICLLLFVFERFRTNLKHSMSDEVVGIYFNFTGVLFTLILAFVVVAAWEDYDNALHTVENEAHKLSYIYEDAIELSPENRDAIQKKVLAYAHSVVHDEWDHMDEIHKVKTTQQKFYDLISLKRTLIAHGDEDALKGIDDDLDELKVIRHERESQSESHVPHLLWAILIGGYMLCIFFSFLINFKSLVWKMIMTSIVAFSMSIVMYLTYCLSTPHKGPMKIGPEDFQKVLELPKTSNIQ
jgi:hypothetical protein